MFFDNLCHLRAIRPGELRQILPRAKGPTGAGNEHGPHIGIGLALAQMLLKRQRQRLIHAVKNVGTIEADGGDTVFQRKNQGVVVGHKRVNEE